MSKIDYHQNFPKGLVPGVSVESLMPSLIKSVDAVTTQYHTLRPPKDLINDESNNKISNIADLVKHVKKHHAKRGVEVSEDDILRMIDHQAEKMGMGKEEGRGFFGNLWNTVKEGAKRAGSRIWDKVKEDPVGTLGSIAALFAE